MVRAKNFFGPGQKKLSMEFFFEWKKVLERAPFFHREFFVRKKRFFDPKMSKIIFFRFFVEKFRIKKFRTKKFRTKKIQKNKFQNKSPKNLNF